MRFLICLLILLPITAVAQLESNDSDYRPFIEDGKQWVVAYHRTIASDDYYTLTYHIDADTVISGQQCRKILAGSDTYAGAVYEEERRVWLFPPNEQEAVMLYDFSVSANTNTKVMLGDAELHQYSSRDCRVQIDYPLACSDYTLRCIGMTDEGEPQHHAYLIMEGVGSYFGPLTNLPLETTGTRCTLLECKVGEKVLFNHSARQSLSKVLHWLSFQAYSATFVQRGRTWHVLEFAVGGEHRFSPLVRDYHFDDEEIVLCGKSYLAMYAASSGQTSQVGLFREEDGKVYQYRGEGESESILYDFTLLPGSTFNDPDMGYECSVTNVSYIECNGYPLRVISIDAVRNEADYHYISKIEWIEGIGTYSKPIMNLADWNLVNSYSCHLAYAITGDGYLYLPMTFGVPWNGWRGTQLTSSGSRDSGADELEYSLEFSPARDSYDLNVSGLLNMPSGPNNYIYSIDSYSEDDIMSHDVTFQIEELPPYSGEVSRQEVSLSFPFFSEGINYTYINPDTHIFAPTIVNRLSLSDEFFDLTGHRLAAPPARGLYIQDGKVKAK